MEKLGNGKLEKVLKMRPKSKRVIQKHGKPENMEARVSKPQKNENVFISS